MTNIHIKSEVSTLRVFSDGNSYAEKSEPIFSCTVHFLSDKEAFICNGVGELSRSMLRKIFKHLYYVYGTALARYERKGFIKSVDLIKLFGETECTNYTSGAAVLSVEKKI